MQEINSLYELGKRFSVSKSFEYQSTLHELNNEYSYIMLETVIVERIMLLRNKHKFTQGEMAAMLGTTQASYWRIENGETALNLETLIKLSDIFKIPLSSLVAPAGDSQMASPVTESMVSEAAPSYAPPKKRESKKIMIELDLTDEEYSEILPILNKKISKMIND